MFRMKLNIETACVQVYYVRYVDKFHFNSSIPEPRKPDVMCDHFRSHVAKKSFGFVGILFFSRANHEVKIK